MRDLGSMSCRDKEFFTSLRHPHRPLYQTCLLFKGSQWLYSGLDVQMTDHLPRLATEFRVSGAMPLPTHKPSSSTTLPFNLSPNSAECKTRYNEGSREIPFMLWLTFRRLMSYIYMEHPFLMFLDHTQRRSTVGRTPLDE